MISRCPSCAAQVPDDAVRCPSCQWDFNARRRIPSSDASDKPPSATAPPAAAPPETGNTPSKEAPSLSGLKMVPFSESLGNTVPPRPAAGAPPPAAKIAPPPAAKAPPAVEPPAPLGLHQFPKIEPRGRAVEDPDGTPAPEPAKFSLPPAKKIPKDEPEAASPKAAAEPPASAPPPPKPAPKEAAKPKSPRVSWFSRKSAAEPAAPAAERESAPPPPPPPPPPPAPAAASKPAPQAPSAKPVVEPPKTMIRKAGSSAPAKGEPPKAKSAPETKPKPGAKAPPRAQGKNAPPLPWPGLAAAAVVAVATGLVYLNMRSDSGALGKGGRAAGGIFAKGAASVRVDAAKLLGGEDDHRDIRNIQRVAIDPQAPASAPVALPPSPAAVPAPALAPAPVAPAAHAAPPPPPPAPAPSDGGRKPTVVLLSTVQLPRHDGSTDKPVERAGGSVVLLQSQAPRVAKRWTFQGEVYDLVNLNPVFDAHLRFLKPDGELAGEVTTDAQGRYKIYLDPILDDYRMVIASPDYEFYLDEIDPPFRSMARVDRVAAASIHSGNHAWHGAVGRITRRTIVAIPKNLPDE